MWPQARQRRRWTQCPPAARHSTQPSPLGAVSSVIVSKCVQSIATSFRGGSRHHGATGTRTVVASAIAFEDQDRIGRLRQADRPFVQLALGDLSGLLLL